MSLYGANWEMEEALKPLLKLIQAKDQHIEELEALLPNNKKQITYERELATLKAQYKDLQERHNGNVRLLTNQWKAVDNTLGITADDRHKLSEKHGDNYTGGFGAFKLLLAEYNKIKDREINEEIRKLTQPR